MKWDKESRESKEPKEPKGKYRCRVNQYIFEKKKSGGKKGEQADYNQFWNNVN